MSTTLQRSAWAIDPVEEGSVDRDGIRIAYSVFGSGEPALLFLPNAPVVHSRQWKAQVPYFARHARVVTFDGRGNGRSDRPTRAIDYGDDVMLDDAFAVLDAVGTERAVVIALSYSVTLACVMASTRPERVLGIVAITPGIAIAPDPGHWEDFEATPASDEGWSKATRSYWLRDYAGWARFFAERLFPESHSTKQIEDATAWQLESSAETNLLSEDAPTVIGTVGEAEAFLRRIRCPVLVVVADRDEIEGTARGERMAELTGASLIRLEGAGHVPSARHPVQINRLIRDFVRRVRISEVPS
jgi:pimeloyl-ACP methyl ester carboxylesterase